MANLTAGTYVEIKLLNKTNYHGDIYVFVQSQTQIYQINPSTFVASPVSSPTNGNAPSIKISELPNQIFYLDASQELKSGRIYFSSSKKAVQISNGSIGGPAPNADFIFDFVELTLYKNKNGEQCINLDTTQIDQFGLPIHVQVFPNDPNYLKGTGIVKTFSGGASADRNKVVVNFQNLTKKTGFKAYSDCIQSSPIQRLIGPQHAINERLPQSQYWIENLKPATNKTYNATANICGTWNDKSPSNPPIASNLTTGMRVSGQGIPAGATVTSVTPPSNNNPYYEVSLECDSSLSFSQKTGAYVSFFPATTSDLMTAFDDAIYNLFNSYTNGKELYICANGTDSGMEIYKGTVITDYKLPNGLTDMDGNTDTEYTVFKFTGTGKKYMNPDNSLSPSTSQGDYVVFYPFFKTNAVSAPHKNLSPKGLPSPPEWFTPNYYPKKGNINFIAPPSYMVFACGGTFADSVYQEKAYGSTTTPLVDDTALGNIENQLVTMLNRGIALPDNFQPRTGYIKSTDLGPIDSSNPISTSQTYHGTTGIQGATTNYVLPGASASEPAIILNSISCKVTLADGTIQNFQVTDGNFNAGVKPANENGAYVKKILFNPPTQAQKIQIQWSVPPTSDVKVEFDYDYGTKLSNKFAKINLISPYKGSFYKSGDFGPTTDLVQGISKGMQMTTMAQFSIPMTVYSVPESGNELIIESSVELQPFNTGILTFADFYPLTPAKQPDGVWNAYSYYFHQGDLGNDVPTVDGRGYAFPFDDNGGYSSDLSVVLDLSKLISGAVEIDLLPL